MSCLFIKKVQEPSGKKMAFAAHQIGPVCRNLRLTMVEKKMFLLVRT